MHVYEHIKRAECASKKKRRTSWGDVWKLKKIVFEMVTSRQLLKIRPRSEKRSTWDDWCRLFVRQMPLCHPNNTIKAIRESDSNQWTSPLSSHPFLDWATNCWQQYRVRSAITTRHSRVQTSVSWCLMSLFSTNMAISVTKGQGWRAMPTQYRKASDILTSTLAAFLFTSHQKREMEQVQTSVKTPSRECQQKVSVLTRI